MRSLTGHQLQRRLQRGDGIRIVDVRDVNEYSAGHIPGAQLIPIEQIPAALYHFRTDEEMIFVCRSGSRSQRVVDYLNSKGFPQALNLKGGMMQWPGRVERGSASEQS